MAGALDTLSILGETILADKEENFPSSDFEFDSASYLLGKESGSRVQGMERRTRQGSVRIPQRLEGVGIDSQACVQWKVK